jgi:hypothetical protein
MCAKHQVPIKDEDTIEWIMEVSSQMDAFCKAIQAKYPTTLKARKESQEIPNLHSKVVIELIDAHIEDQKIHQIFHHIMTDK